MKDEREGDGVDEEEALGVGDGRHGLSLDTHEPTTFTNQQHLMIHILFSLVEGTRMYQ